MKLADTLALGSTLTDENMVFLRQIGVDSVVVSFPDLGPNEAKGKSPLPRLREGNYYEVEDLVILKKWVESHGLKLDGLFVMFNHTWDKVILGQPGRDEQIENWNKSLRNMGKAGIPIYQYNIMINEGAWLPIWRTSRDNSGRGGTSIVRFDYEATKKAPLTKLGEIKEDAMWDNLIYFLKAIIPVAEKAGVTMAMHPCDPQVPSIAGVCRIIRSLEAYDRVFKIVPSKANAMTLCLGCMGQMMDNEGVYKTIRKYGAEGKIAHVHFRNVRGTREKFDEVWPDDGQLDLLEAVKVLKEVGYNGMLSLDHVPGLINDDSYGHIARAFMIGYLRGIMQGAGAIG